MIVTTIYYLLSGVTFFKLLTASGETALDVESLVMNRVWRAPLAATFLGSLLVFGFNMFSCCILIKYAGPGAGGAGCMGVARGDTRVVCACPPPGGLIKWHATTPGKALLHSGMHDAAAGSRSTAADQASATAS